MSKTEYPGKNSKNEMEKKEFTKTENEVLDPISQIWLKKLSENRFFLKSQKQGFGNCPVCLS